MRLTVDEHSHFGPPNTPILDQDIVTRLQDQANAPALAWLTEAADEIERLRALVSELLPFMTIDVLSGVKLGPAPASHSDECDDCLWYEISKKWEKRIHSGEFDKYVPNLSKVWRNKW